MYVENIVVGNPACEPSCLLAKDIDDWNSIEKERTFFTQERFLPKILVELGFYPSISEIRRNKPELCVNLDKVDFIDKLKIKKKQFVWIVVGE